MDVSLASLGCKTVPVTGSLQVTGTWTANSNGTYTDNTVTTGSVTFPLAAACLSVSSVNVAVRQGSGGHHGARLGHGHLFERFQRPLHLLGHRQPERRPRRGLSLGDDQRQLHDLGLRPQHRRHRGLLVLRLGKHADRDPEADDSPASPARSCSRRAAPAGTGGTTGTGGATGSGRHHGHRRHRRHRDRRARRPAAGRLRAETAARAGRPARRGTGGAGKGGSGGTSATGGTAGASRDGAVRHLRGRQHRLRRGAQHGARSARRLQRQSLQGQARVGRHDQGHRRRQPGRPGRHRHAGCVLHRARRAPSRSFTTSPATETSSRPRRPTAPSAATRA